MSNSPSIIFNCGYCHPDTPSEKNDFYRCKNSNFNIIEYMDRKGASDKLNDEDIARIKAFVEDTNITGKSIVGYADQRQGSTGIFCKDTSDTPEKMAERLKKTGSIIWHSVLSFTPEIGNKFCSSKQDAEKIIRENLPLLFKKYPEEKAALDYDNIDWLAAYHTNTDNRHIHLVFWEKEPKIIDKDGNKSYRKTGRLSTEHFDDFKAKIAHSFTKHNLEYFSMRDEIRQDVSSILKSDKNTFEALLRRSSSIVEKGHFQYARLHPDQRKIIDQFVGVILQNNPQVGSRYDLYKHKLANSQAEYIKLYTDNHIKHIPSDVTNFYSHRTGELNSRLGNALLKQLKDYAFKKNELEKSVGYINGVWTDSKLSPKNRKAIMSKELTAFASSAMRLFLAEAAPAIEGHLQSDEEFRKQLKSEGKDTIYE